MSTILIIILLILIFGGGGGYYAHGRYGTAGLGGVLGIVLIVLIVALARRRDRRIRTAHVRAADAGERARVRSSAGWNSMGRRLCPAHCSIGRRRPARFCRRLSRQTWRNSPVLGCTRPPIFSPPTASAATTGARFRGPLEPRDGLRRPAAPSAAASQSSPRQAPWPRALYLQAGRRHLPRAGGADAGIFAEVSVHMALGVFRAYPLSMDDAIL